MPTNQSQRPRFYENQYLGAEDLSDIVEYDRIQQARHLLGAHSWGIAMGLQLKEKTSPGGQIEMYIQPGYAWDGFGRPIVVLSPYKLPAEKFKSFLDDGSPNGQQIPVWLRYSSTETRGPRQGFEVCDTADQNSRIQESFQIEVGERQHADQHDLISLAGRSVDAQQALKRFDPTDPLVYDESIPYQTFPDETAKARWLIPLGVVRWKPNTDPSLPGQFLPRTTTGPDSDIARSRALRRYIGVVAEYVQAADGRIRLRDRTKDYSQVPSDDLVWVEGSLRIDGDVRIFATKLDGKLTGKLTFLDEAGQDQGAPLSIQRLEDNTRGGKDLLVVIGQDNKGKNSFAIGPLDATGKPQEKFVVRDDGRVGIGTTTPLTALHIPEQGLQIGVSPTASDNFYLASDQNDGSSGTGLRGLRLYNGNSGSGTATTPSIPLLTVLSDGRVGISTTPQTQLHVRTHLAVGPFSAAQNEGGIDVTGPFAELSFARRSLTSRPAIPALGDRFAWYNPDGTARLWTEVRGDLLTVTNDGFVGIRTTAPPSEALEVNGNIRIHGSIELNTSAGDVFLATGTETLRIVRGTVRNTPAGTVFIGNGFNIGRPAGAGNGIYQINFSSKFPSAPSGSVTQISFVGVGGGDGKTTDNAVIIEITPIHVRLKTGKDNGDGEDRDFTFIFVGPNL